MAEPEKIDNQNRDKSTSQTQPEAETKLEIEEEKPIQQAPSISPEEEMSAQSKVITAPSTQQYLGIEEIHNGTVIMKNGGMRMVLMVSAINFSLKSEAEQNSIIYSFQNFLNGLGFPIQIVMQSRRLDLSSYLAKLRDEEKGETNPLLRLHMTDYISFVEQLLNVANIMQKKFYIVIPYQPIIIKKENILKKLSNLFSGKARKKEIVDFEMHRKELAHRTEIIASGLGSMGLRAVQLGTLELAELYYSSYNPEVSSRQKLYSLEDIMAPVVEMAPSSEKEKK